ncbi:MAG: hypothetical protein COY41_04675 [Candidatus Altarchaeum sp. CG_4_10_14_0_8_um_filter_32_851]|nr:MAG: hypothetical protein COY41_04675 [Candidatus Altarchaeum sp. CG_4_10_14_0_8_um_filter_32_851]
MFRTFCKIENLKDFYYLKNPTDFLKIETEGFSISKFRFENYECFFFFDFLVFFEIFKGKFLYPMNSYNINLIPPNSYFFLYKI